MTAILRTHILPYFRAFRYSACSFLKPHPAVIVLLRCLPAGIRIFVTNRPPDRDENEKDLHYIN